MSLSLNPGQRGPETRRRSRKLPTHARKDLRDMISAAPSQLSRTSQASTLCSDLSTTSLRLTTWILDQTTGNKSESRTLPIMIAQPASRQKSDGAPPLKRSLFSKPSWSSAKNLETADLFHRSDQLYAKTANEAEQERKWRLEKKNKGKGGLAQTVERSPKRQKLSASPSLSSDDEDEGDSEESHGDSEYGPKKSKTPPKRSTDLDIIKEPSLERGNSARRVTPPIPKTDLSSLLNKKQNNSKERESAGVEKVSLEPSVSTIIDLDDEDQEEDSLTILKPRSTPSEEVIEVSASKVDDDPLVSDDEFPELARKAREKAQRKRLQQDVRSPTLGPNDSASQGGFKRSYSHISNQSAFSPPPPAEPTVSILVTSDIPNTQPLLVKRRLGQSMKDVRVAWTERQPLGDIKADEVFLTWRGKKIFDVTTCRSLGLTIDTYGNVLAHGDVIGEREGRLQVEAMTAKMFEARQKARAEGADGEQQDDEVKEVEQPNEEEDTGVRIILKAKGFEDLKLKVKAVRNIPPVSFQDLLTYMCQTTLVSTITTAFRKANQIQPHRDVFVQFDGDRLAPELAIQDTEVSDLDYLDVYVK